MGLSVVNIQGLLSVLQVYALLLVMLAARIALAESGKFPCGYDYLFKPGAWFKMHTQGAYRSEARFTCYSEGTELASPTSEDMKKAMMALMVNNNNKYNETSNMLIHTAMPIQGKVKHKIDYRMRDDIRWASIALTETGRLQIVSRYTKLPFICYKDVPQDLQLNECGTTDSNYIFDNRTNKCYKFHRNKLSWVLAAQSCAAEGGYLAIINSEEEAKVIQEIFAFTPTYTIHGDDIDFAFLGYWADGERVWRTVQGQSLSEAGYEGWSPGEPNNAKYSIFYEYCGSIARNGKLFDNPCSLFLPFICEKNINRCESCTALKKDTAVDIFTKENRKKCKRAGLASL